MNLLVGLLAVVGAFTLLSAAAAYAACKLRRGAPLPPTATPTTKPEEP